MGFGRTQLQIEWVVNTSFLKSVIDMKLWPNVGNNQCKLHMQRNQTIGARKLCAIMWNETGKKVLNSFTEMNLIFCTKAIVGNDSFKTPPAWRSSDVILVCSSTQSSNFKKFCGPLLWTLIFSSLQTFSVVSKSSDWLGHVATSFSLFKTNWVFPWLFVWYHHLAELSTLISFSSSW